MGAAVVAAPALRPRPRAVRADHGARVDRQAHGPRRLGEGLGAAAARQVRRARRRHRDGLAVEQVHAAAPDQGRGGAGGEARLPAALVGAAVRRAAALDRGRGRARADRPSRGAAGARRRRLRRHAGRAGLVPARSRPRRLRGRRRPGALRRGRRHGAQRRLRRPARRRAARGGGGGVPGEGAVDRVLRRAVPAARARPAVQPVLLDQRRRPRAAVRRADRAHELHRARALRRPPLPVRRQLPAARPRAAVARRGRAARPLRGGAAGRSIRRSRATGSERRGCTASPPRSRSSPSATTSASRRSPPRRAGLCSPTRRRSIPRTAAPTTRCASGATPPARCSADLAHDVARRLVLAQADELRVAQAPVRGPLAEADLCDELRLDPGRAQPRRVAAGER